jgi:hypothetical protein
MIVRVVCVLITMLPAAGDAIVAVPAATTPPTGFA